MARILKNNRSIINPYDGNPNEDAYLIVDDLEINKRGKYVGFTVRVYADRAARIANRDPLMTQTVWARDADFDTYFSTNQNAKIWTQIDNYLDAVPLPGLVADDWKKDPDAEP